MTSKPSILIVDRTHRARSTIKKVISGCIEMTLDLDSLRANGRQAFPGVDWLFPVQLSRVAGLTGHVNDRSAKAYLGAFKGALKGLIFSQFQQILDGGPSTGQFEKNSII